MSVLYTHPERNKHMATGTMQLDHGHGDFMLL